MLRYIIFLTLSIINLISYADETKRQNIIQDIVNKELGSTTYLQTIDSNFKDSVNVQPYDSVCIRQAIRAWDGFMEFADNFAEFKVNYSRIPITIARRYCLMTNWRNTNYTQHECAMASMNIDD